MTKLSLRPRRLSRQIRTATAPECAAMDIPTTVLSDAVIEDAIARYWREHDRYVKLATRVGEICRA